MPGRTACWAVLLCLGAMAPLVSAETAAPAAAPAQADQAAIQAAVSRSVCTVTVENKWGIPMGVASGFLLTDGKFAITDLGLVAQPGISQVTCQFKDGEKLVCREFAMADASLGLVALRVAGDAPARAGLPLASALPPLDGTATVSTAGWRWASQLDAVSGHLRKGPAIKDAAVRAHVDTPMGIDSFARTDGPRLEAATGSVLLDPEGTVLGTVLEVTIRGTSAPLAIPSSTLRAALLSAQPQLKPLSDLPKSPWPTRYMRLPGQPATAAAWTKALADARKAMICPTCSGKGKTVVVLDAPGGGGRPGGGRPGGRPGGATPGPGPGNLPGGTGRNSGDVQTQPCQTCAGEKYVMGETVWTDLLQMIEMGTRITWAPTTEDRTRQACRKDMRTMLAGLASVGRRFDKAFNAAVVADLARTGATLPRPMIFRAQVKEHLDAPDGKYLLVAPLGSNLLLTAAVDDTMQLGGKATLGDRKEPADGSWVLACGMALARFEGGDHQGLFLLPFEWLAVPAPAAPDAAGDAAAAAKNPKGA